MYLQKYKSALPFGFCKLYNNGHLQILSDGPDLSICIFSNDGLYFYIFDLYIQCTKMIMLSLISKNITKNVSKYLI